MLRSTVIMDKEKSPPYMFNNLFKNLYAVWCRCINAYSVWHLLKQHNSDRQYWVNIPLIPSQTTETCHKKIISHRGYITTFLECSSLIDLFQLRGHIQPLISCRKIQFVFNIGGQSEPEWLRLFVEHSLYQSHFYMKKKGWVLIVDADVAFITLALV